MSMRTLLVLAVVLGAAPAAQAAEVRLNLGADYWFNRSAIFSGTIAVGGRVTRGLEIGGRFGALIVTNGNTVGVPLDLYLRGRFSGTPIYLEGLVGPWILFAGDPLKAHAGFGFGFDFGGISLGAEVAWLDPSGMIGARLGFSF